MTKWRPSRKKIKKVTMEKVIKINYLTVLLATLAAFMVSSIWYFMFGPLWLALQGIDPSTVNKGLPVWKILTEVGRSFILAYVLAYFISVLNINSWKNALKFCWLLWIGFPLIILSGSVIHENVHWGIAAIHAGDWLIKLFIMIIILSFKNIKRAKQNGKFVHQPATI